jgi:hypothetical protein
LRFNERNVLPGPGQVSREEADRRAIKQYGKFEERRRLAAEQAGEADVLRQLEQTAKQVEQSKTAKPKPERGGKK